MPRSFHSIVLFLFLLISCQNIDSTSLTAEQYSLVKDSVRHMVTQIAVDVNRDGPIAWLKHFTDTTGFFMASEGQLMFPSYDSATEFIQKRLVKMVTAIELSWSDIHIDPLSINLAVVGASFKEVITDSAGHKLPESGYFTGLAQRTSKGWQLRNVHWSISAGTPVYSIEKKSHS